MFARVTSAESSPGDVDAWIEYIRENVLVQARQIPGWQGVIDLVNRSTGKNVTITLWESEAAMQASGTAAEPLRSQAAKASNAKILSVDRFEVSTMEVNSSQ